MILVRRRSTDEVSEFDMKQLLLFEEVLHQHEAIIGPPDARSHTAAEMPQVFDSPTMQAAVGTGDPLLPSYLAQELGLGRFPERLASPSAALRGRSARHSPD